MIKDLGSISLESFSCNTICCMCKCNTDLCHLVRIQMCATSTEMIILWPQTIVESNNLSFSSNPGLFCLYQHQWYCGRLICLIFFTVLDKEHLRMYTRECGEKKTLGHCWWECKLVQTLWKTVWRFLKKNFKITTIWSSNSTSGY